MSITSKYEIDGNEAIRTMQSIQAAFQGYNNALGQVISQSSQYNAVGGKSRQVLTLINAEGQKTTAVLREVAGGYELVSSKTNAATASQRKMASGLKEQADLADKLAKSFGRTQGPPVANPVTTTIPATAPSRVGLPIGAYASLTEAQLKAAAAANNFSIAQTNSFIATARGAATAKVGFDTLAAAANNFGNTLNQIGKIAFATLIYRGISLIQQGLANGAKSALDYGHEIGLIQTISQDSGDSFDSWNKAIRSVADELGRPVAEVARDTYYALSNQVIKSTKDFDLLRTAITLEQNTGSAAGTGINTISALLNGLGVSALEAQNLADKLFVTIDVGRVRLEELDKVLGRTISLQQQAGATFNETAGALAVITQSGIESAEATTLLNNVYSEIIKPNEKLAATLKELGYSSGAAAVQATGLAGILKQLGDIAKKTPNGLATFFPDIRGLRGASTLFTQTDNFLKAIEAVQNAGGSNKAAKGILDENDAQKILKEAERIKNYFTVDLGVGIIHTLAKISDSFGGFKSVIASLTPVILVAGGSLLLLLSTATVVKFGAALGQLAYGFVAVAAKIGIADAAALAFGATVTQVQITLATFAAAASAAYILTTLGLNKLADAQVKASEALAKPIKINVAKQIDSETTFSSVMVENFNTATERMTSRYQQFIAKAHVLNNEFATDAKKKFDEASENIQNSFSVISTYIRKNISDLEAAEEKSLTNIKTLTKDATQVKLEAANRQRDYQIDAIKTQYEKQKEYASKTGGFVSSQGAVDQFAKIANSQIAQARQARDAFLSKGDIKGAQEEYNKINETIAKFKANVESVGGRTIDLPKLDQFYANEQATKLLDSKKKIEDQNKKEYEQTLQQRKLAEKLSDVYKEQAKFGDEVFDKQGNLNDKFKGDPKKALAEYDALNKKRQDLQKGLAAPKEPIEASRFNRALTEANQEAAQQRNALAARLAASQQDASLTTSSQSRVALAESERKAYAALTEVILGNNKKLIEGAGEIQKILAEFSQNLKNPFQTTDNLGNDPFGALAGVFTSSTLSGPQTNKAQQLLADIKNLSAQADVDIPKIKGKLDLLEVVTKPIKDNKLVDPKDATTTITIQQALERLQGQLGTLQSFKDGAASASTRLNELQTAVSKIDATQVQSLVSSVEALNAAASGLTADAGGVKTLTESLNAAAIAAENTAAAIRQLNAARGGAGGGGAAGGEPAGGRVEGHAGGGMVGSQGGFLADFYSGKFAKGSDTIPAMLTRGEFVVKPSATQKFFSQLVAMNNGASPIYRSEGGPASPTSNTSHNYNININGGTRNSETTKVVVQAIRRAQRQGTIK